MKILKFTDFSKIYEADEMGMDSLVPGEAPAGAPEAPNSKKYVFIFIDADKGWAAEYPTGGGIKKYKRYEVSDADLTKWLEDSKLSDKAQEFKEALTGEKDFEKKEFYQFKQALRDKSLHFKELGDLDVEYDEHMVPYTNDIDVTFLKAAKAEHEKKEEKKEETENKEEKPEDATKEVQ